MRWQFYFMCVVAVVLAALMSKSRNDLKACEEEKRAWMALALAQAVDKTDPTFEVYVDSTSAGMRIGVRHTSDGKKK